MRTSDSIAAIAPALVKAQAACLAVVKDKTAKIVSTKGTYEYQYSDFASVIEQAKPALAANGLAMIQWAERHDDGITVVSRLQHESGEWQETDIFIPVAMVSAQAIGSAFTYGKRYGAQAFMLMPSADDDAKDATANPPAKDRKDTARQVTVDAFEALPDEKKDVLRTHASTLQRLHQTKGDAAAYIARQNFDDEAKLALWSLLPSNVRSWIKDQQEIARMNAAAQAMKNTKLASQA